MVIAIIVIIADVPVIIDFTLYGGNFTCAAVVAAVDGDVARSPYTHTQYLFILSRHARA